MPEFDMAELYEMEKTVGDAMDRQKAAIRRGIESYGVELSPFEKSVVSTETDIYLDSLSVTAESDRREKEAEQYAGWLAGQDLRLKVLTALHLESIVHDDGFDGDRRLPGGILETMLDQAIGLLEPYARAEVAEPGFFDK